MSVLAHLASAAVGAVLAYAGARKSLDVRGWLESAAAQGLPRSIAAPVPLVELVLGACLVGLGPQLWSLSSATLLLTVFTAFLAVQVATGSAVPCACFGAAAQRPPRWRDVVRNLGLIGLLVLAAASV